MEKEAVEVFNTWQVAVQEQVVASWWKLADFLVMKYNDGRVNSPAMGRAIGYPQWYAGMVGFSDDIHPVWVQPAMKPPLSVQGYVAPAFTLPRYWDGDKQAWSIQASPNMLSATSNAPEVSTLTSQVIVQVVSLLFAVVSVFVTGVFIGRRYEQSKRTHIDTYLLLR